MGIGGNLLSVELDIPVFPAGFVEVFEVFHLVSCFPRGGTIAEMVSLVRTRGFRLEGADLDS